MYGNNPIRRPEQGDGQTLGIKHIFATLQGEGPFAGHPAIFVRLGGCNLACDFCDTDFEEFTERAMADIVAEVDRLSARMVRRCDLVVITGGEPFRQNIVPLCAGLIERGYRVQIETNGTLLRPVDDAVTIVCSPKVAGADYVPVRGDLLARANALKFLLSRHDARYAAVPEIGQAGLGIPVYVQPMDEGDPELNAENLAYATEVALREGHRLSVQLHKLLAIE